MPKEQISKTLYKDILGIKNQFSLLFKQWKIFLIIIIGALLLITPFKVFTQITVNFQTDFGGIGNNSANNLEAFIKASRFIDNHFSQPNPVQLTLEIPSEYMGNTAVYLVDNQVDYLGTYTFNDIYGTYTYYNTQYLKAGLKLIELKNNVDGLTIKGTNPNIKPIIRYKGGMYHGAFLPPNSYFTNCTPNYYTYVFYQINCGTPGSCISGTLGDNCGHNQYTYGTSCDLDNICDNPLTTPDIEKEGAPTAVDSVSNVSNAILPFTLPSYAPANNDTRTLCFLGHCIEIVGSKNVSIEGIEIDGNNTNMVWGTRYGDLGIQAPHHGIFIMGDSKNITVNDVYVHNSCYDGIEMHDGDTITVNNSIFEYNARQAISWTGGKNLNLNNSEFNYSGQAYNNNNVQLISIPNSNFDIEPEGVNHLQLNSSCENGTITLCKFKDPAGTCVVNDGQKLVARDIKFDRCVFDKAGEFGIWLRGKHIIFEKCSVNAPVIHANDGIDPGDETRFVDCDFRDITSSNVPWPDGLIMADVAGCRGVEFKDCSFVIANSQSQYLSTSPNWPDTSRWCIVDNCTFDYQWNGDKNNILYGTIAGTRFRNNNSFINSLNKVNSYNLVIMSSDVIIEGSNDPCAPHTLSFEGQVECLIKDGSNDFIVGKASGYDNYAQLLFKDRALLAVEDEVPVSIGPESSLHILNGASTGPAGKFKCNGGFFAHSGSYVNLNWNILNNGFSSPAPGTNSLVYLDKECNKNGIHISPYWCNGIGYGAGTYSMSEPGAGSWYGSLTASCVQGGHTDLSAYGCIPSATYTNAESSHGISLMYNKNVSCFGTGAMADFQFTITGGEPSYTVTCASINNGSPLNAGNVYSNIPTATYTVQVTDASNCTETFLISLDTTLEYNILKGCTDGTTPAVFTNNACYSTVSGPGTAYYQGNYTWWVSTPGTYTITATTAQNTTVTKTFYIGNCSACANVSLPDEAEWFAPNASSSVISPDGLLPPKSIVLQGTVAVDNEWLIYNNPDVFLTAGTELVLQADQALVINKTHLKGCTDYWTGITANADGERIIINNNSTVQDMDNGIMISNNAFIQASKSTFLNNNTSVTVSNNMTPSMESLIYGNTFTGNAGMFANANANKPDIGIRLSNMGNYNIGVLDDAESQNLFENMTTGIYITNSIFNVENSTIGIYNSEFKNITHPGTDYEKVANCYISRKGAAVYCKAGPSFSKGRNLDVQNKNALAFTQTYDSCDKMVVGINCGVTARYLNGNNCLLGIMCNNVTGKHIYIDYNTLHNVQKGVQMIGDNASSQIMGNNIVTLGGGITSPNWYGILWPSGIHVNQVMNSSTGSLEIKSNTIDITGVAGTGLSLYNTGQHAEVYGNGITFSSTDNSPSGYPMSNMLNGIYGVAMQGSKISKNTINGNDDLQSSPRENIHGILINSSNNNIIQCNTLQKTRFGLGAISACTTSTQAVRGNVVFKQVLGWAFRHLGDEGTFGDVGDNSHDNNNLFLGAPYVSKVFKFCEALQSYQIFTDPNTLTLSESNSYRISDSTNNTCPYDVDVNTGIYTTYECPVLPVYLQAGTSTGFSHTQAISIIMNTKTYSEFPEISHWMDERKLYRQLELDSVFRVSNDTLENFYTAMLADIIAQIESADDRLAELLSSMESQDYELYLERLEVARETNSNIVSDEEQEENEETINAIYLKILEYGTDSLTTEDSTNMAILAALCPYTGGTAVYKARALYAMYEPSLQYDDIIICNNIGVYKNGNNSSAGIFDKENEYLKALKPKENIFAAYNGHKFLLYPNPTTTTITIAYELEENETGTVIVYDILGREQLQIHLHRGNNKVSINVSSLKGGLYTYKYMVNKTQNETGKLLIQ